MKAFVLAILLASFSLHAQNNAYTIVKDENDIKIKTPSLLDRKTLKLRLSNGVKAYLISDPGLDKSGAGVAMQAGSWQNPDEYPGTAHFLEHLLFLGTEKYPQESEYQRYLDEHAGNHNAFTEGDRTVYMFSVSNNGFKEALDRFAQFFIAPLFNPSGIAREVNAIDQEYAKNIQKDNWRLAYTQKTLENPNHPDSKFDIGNLQTISKIPQSTLKEWYNSHYSANLMYLVVYSTLPLETLRDLVVQDFGGIENKNLPLFQPSEALTTASSQGDLVFVSPYQDVRHLVLEWEIPSTLRYDASVVSYVLGYEDKHSLSTLLKDEGLAEQVSVGTELYTPSMIFTIDISLTEDGVKNYEKVIAHCFEGINLLKERGIPRAIFDEMQNIATVSYEYQSRQDVFESVMNDATQMVDEPLETYPKKTLIPTQYDQEALKVVIDSLNPESCHYFILAKPELTDVKPNLKEPWLGAEYSIQKIPQELLNSWAKRPLNPKLELPKPNPFIPSDLKLLQTAAQDKITLVPKTEVVVDDQSGLIYYAEDKNYLVPEVYASFRIHTPSRKPGHSVQDATLDLYIKCLDEQLNEIGYQGKVAHLAYKIKPIESGIELIIQGYTEKAALFFKQIINALKTLSPSTQVFCLQKDALQKSYENLALDTPLAQTQELMRSIIYKNYVTNEKKASALKNITREALIRFANHLFDKSYIEGVVYGSITKEEGIELVDMLRDTLKSKPYPKVDIKKKLILQLNDSQGPYTLCKKIEQSGNVAMLLVEDGCYSIKKRSALQLLSKGIQEPFFSELRTRQQTGYLVATADQEIERELMQIFLVQSNTHDPCDLTARFELFLENILRDLETTQFPNARFETIKQSLIVELSTPQTNISDMGLLLSTLAFDYDGDFNRIEKRIQGLQELSYEDFVDFVREFLGRSNKRRLSLQVFGVLPKENELHYTVVPSCQRIRSLGEFLSAEQNICNEE